MKKIKSIIFWLVTLSFSILADDNKVIVEIFTNSDCGACVAAHKTLEHYLQGINGDKVEFVYYHIEWPSPLDQLYTYNIGDSKNKNSFYGPYFASPQAFFNGKHVENSYTNWAGLLDELTENQSDFQIQLSGSRNSASFTINADVTKIAENNYSDLTINYVVVENVYDAGVNGITDHKHVMRKIHRPQGMLFDVELNETVELSALMAFKNSWNIDSLKIVVFVQNQSTKEIYQTSSIDFGSLILTDLKISSNVQTDFHLEQNYPNPFNPTTTIKYSLPSLETLGNVSLQIKIFDILGREVATLVNDQQEPGNYEIVFDAAKQPAAKQGLTSGIYFYQMRAGDFIQTKRMNLLK